MSHTRARNGIGTSTLKLLVGALFAIGMIGMSFAAGSAQGLPGMPEGFDQGDWDEGEGGWDDGDWEDSGIPSPREACLAVFPDGIIVGDPVVGTVDCSLIFGGGPPTEEPTEEPTEVPTEEPTEEPTHKPDHDHDHDHDHDKKHDHDHHHDKKHEGEKEDVGGKAAPTVTTMPSTGHGPESGGNTATATILAAMALVLATLSGVTLRLIGARSTRR